MNAIQKGIENQRLLKEYGNEILEEYKKTCSANHIVKKYNISRSPLEKFLKDKNVYLGNSLEVHQARYEKAKSTMMHRYGVENNGQSNKSKESLKRRNSLKKTNIGFIDELEKYTKEVEFYTNKNKKLVLLTDYCYYTGIKFADCVLDEVNPNDYLKRTIDHKISVVSGFFSNIDPSIIGSHTNLIYCIRHINTLKCNSSLGDESFKIISLKIREKLINEGHQHN